MDEKERTMDIIKGYVEVNDDVENETMIGRSMARKTKESCKCDTYLLILFIPMWDIRPQCLFSTDDGLEQSPELHP